MIQVTETKHENITYSILGVNQQKTANGWQAEITFDKRNEQGGSIGTEVIRSDGEDYNTFWANYNSGAYLVELLIAQLNINAEVPENVESEFINEQ